MGVILDNLTSLKTPKANASARCRNVGYSDCKCGEIDGLTQIVCDCQSKVLVLLINFPHVMTKQGSSRGNSVPLYEFKTTTINSLCETLRKAQSYSNISK